MTAEFNSIKKVFDAIKEAVLDAEAELWYKNCTSEEALFTRSYELNLATFRNEERLAKKIFEISSADVDGLKELIFNPDTDHIIRSLYIRIVFRKKALEYFLDCE